MTHGAKLEQQLAALDLSNVDLARMVEVSPSTVQRWLSDRVRVPTAVVKLLDCMLQLRRIGAEAVIEGESET